jgi:NitT/TauT family transport system ATP-binding protein
VSAFKPSIAAKATEADRGSLAAAPSNDATATAVVSVEQVTRIFTFASGDQVFALGPIDLAVTRGEFFSVVGPSGCGKSTLLDILAGLSVPTAGRVTFEGREVRGDVPQGIGVVFQEDASFAWLSVRDNVAFGLRRAGMDPVEINRRVD